MLNALHAFGIFLLIFVAYTIRINMAEKKRKKPMESFIQKEINASKTPKKEIGSQWFVAPDKAILPFHEYGENALEDKRWALVAKKQKYVQKKIDLPMVRFDQPMNNTALKEQFGARNLEKLIFYEDHYNGFIRALLEWAQALAEVGENTEACTVLEEAVRLKGDFSKIYVLLGDFYYKEQNTEKLLELTKKAEQIQNSATIKALPYLNSLLDALE